MVFAADKPADAMFFKRKNIVPWLISPADKFKRTRSVLVFGHFCLCIRLPYALQAKPPSRNSSFLNGKKNWVGDQSTYARMRPLPDGCHVDPDAIAWHL
jgi:hypothetical protein